MPRDNEALDHTGILDGYAEETHAYEPTEQDRDLVVRLKEMFDHAFEAKFTYERDWEWYRLYLKGEQTHARNNNTGEIVRLSAEDTKRLRAVNNVLRPTARSLVGKLSKITPTCTVLPATSDFDEQWGAKVADKFLAFIRRKEKLDVKYTLANEFLPWAGNAFLQVEWDHDAGRDIVFCEVCNFFSEETKLEGDPCPQCQMQREQEMQQHELETQQFGAEQAELQSKAAQLGEELPPEIAQQEPPAPPQLGPLPPEQDIPYLIGANEGDVRIHVRDPREVFIDPAAICLEQADWVVIRVPTSIHALRTEFPDFAHIISSEEEIYTQVRSEITFDAISSGVGNSAQYRDTAFRYEFHEKPTNMYPDGRVIVMVNSTVVSEDASPYFKCFGRFPFFHFGFDENAGEFWKESPVSQSWHQQREINAVETQKREHIELLLKPKLFNPIGSRVNQDEFTALTGQVIAYNPAVPRPEFANVPPVPQDLWHRVNELASFIRQQFGVTEQEAGMSPSDPNGRAMAIIEAEADQQLGPILTRNHDEWREMHRAILCLIQEFYHPDRKITVAGPDGSQTYSFDDLNLEPGWDIQVEQEDGLSRNPAVRLTQAMDLLNVGVFTDPTSGQPDTKAFMQKAGIKQSNSGYDLEGTERARAAEIPYKIERGIPHIPEMIDVPGIFADEIEGWLRGPGRRADAQQRQQVMEVWGFYKGWSLQPDMMPEGLGQPVGGPGAGGPDSSAPGGTPNNPGRLGTDMAGGSNVAQEAGQQVNQADVAAEGQARVQMNREG